MFAGTNCELLWTGGFAAVSGSNDNWMWNMSTHTQPAEYLPWRSGEPNNHKGQKEDAIIVKVSLMEFQDMTPSQHENLFKKFCYICERN